jgi:DNA-binding LacI/PurR family transcriptional regulator
VTLPDCQPGLNLLVLFKILNRSGLLREGEPEFGAKDQTSTIAEALGLSTATVSLALRDSPLVADVTRDRIKEKAIELGYIYNRRAASLRTSRSGIIGVVVHDIMNPFYAEILKAIETELDRSRQTFILSNHYDSVDKQRNFIETLLAAGR